MKNIICILFILTLVSCGRKPSGKPEMTSFKLPIIIQPTTTDTIEYFDVDHISQSFPTFVGKSKFCDTLMLSIRQKKDTAFVDDFIDDKQLLRSGTLRADGFELFPNYNSTVCRIDYDFKKGNYNYPVHIVNQTLSTKVFRGKDGYVFAIQEALDSSQNWRPIEGRGFDFCGWGYWGLLVHPNEFVTILLPKYQGNYKTKIRVRINIGDIIYLSTPFTGTINYEQFYLDKSDEFHYRQLTYDKTSAINYLFYGSEPLEFQYKNFGLHAVGPE